MAYHKSTRNSSRHRDYAHLLRAMRAGDVIYLPDKRALFDRRIWKVVFKKGGRSETTRFLAVNSDPALAHRIVRVTMIRPMMAAKPAGRPKKPKGDKSGLSQD